MTKEDLCNKFLDKKIVIVYMHNEPQYNGSCGVVKYVDDLRQLHGTWGTLAVQPEHDVFTLLEDI